MARRKSPGAFAVGYGRPPQASRFKPGQSGNPRGRPKGAKGVGAVLRTRLLAKVTITENGRRRQITVLEALIAKLIKGAFDGDSRSVDKLTKLFPLLDEELAEETRAARSAEAADQVDAARDRAVLDEFAKLLGGSLDETLLDLGEADHD